MLGSGALYSILGQDPMHNIYLEVYLYIMSLCMTAEAFCQLIRPDQQVRLFFLPFSLWGLAVDFRQDFLLVDGTANPLLNKLLSKNQVQLFSLKIIKR